MRFNIFIDSRLSTLLIKLTNLKSRINDHFHFSLGITPYDKYKGHSKELIKNRQFHSPVKLDNNYKPLISGKNIKAYYVENEIVEYLNYGDWLGAPRKEVFFIKPRIIVRQIVSGNDMSIFAGFTDEPLYHTQIGFSIIENGHSKLSIKYLLAVINSSLIKFYHKFKFLDYEKKTFQKILIENCKKFPIPNIKESYQKPFIELIDQILTAKKVNPQADTSALEAEIDRLVYELYGLTEEEIAIVEESVG